VSILRGHNPTMAALVVLIFIRFLPTFCYCACAPSMVVAPVIISAHPSY